MDNDTLDAWAQHPRKIQKSGDRPDVGRAALADPLQTAGEWKLVLCHVPARLQFTDVLKFFQNIELKGVVQEVVYGKRKAIEVLFRCKVDMKMALGEYHLQKLDGHQVFLKLPKDALEELDNTAYFWNFLPLHVKNEVFSCLAPFSAGRILTRVCREWKRSLRRAKGRYPGLYVEDDISTEKKFLSSALFQPHYLERPQPPEKEVRRVVLCSPYAITPSDFRNGCLSSVKSLKYLTVTRTNFLPTEFLSGDLFTVFKHLESFTSVDSFLHFKVMIGRKTTWNLALLMPRLKLTIPTSPEVDKGKFLAGEVVKAVESLDLWWPYPAKQTEWLRTSLTKLDKGRRVEIWNFLQDHNRRTYREAMVDRLDFDMGMTFEQHTLDKRDCAFIGQYITYVKHEGKHLPRVKLPPCKWLYSYFTADCEDPQLEDSLSQIRQRGWVRTFRERLPDSDLDEDDDQDEEEDESEDGDDEVDEDVEDDDASVQSMEL